ncbi:3-methyl-2-oxobutanoate hydroxymethyltransferase [Methylocella sp.]|jgi:3-methyl-2-oxobutanoate hydroxymethyltransferase|uniref:3-methyl-2-oxobutanoate hydroxymethyltransferase n=1 Tax=Methylocella sp. TaxID=1978226 RepID=UPI003C2A0B95
MSKAAHFFEMKRRGAKIAVLTAYDAPTARAEAEAGVDIILVGDSVGVNMLGYASEREVTLADMRHHIAAVRRGAPEATIIGDLPFQTYDSPAAAVANAQKLVAAGADIVKFEGAHLAILEALEAASIEVCCHLGLEPQTHLEKRVKGRSAQEALRLLADAIALDRAGMELLLLEMIPEEVAAEVTRSVKAPTIGIGAGRKTDGQVLVITDVLGFGPKNFRHNRRYGEVGALMAETARAYVKDVQSGAFPAEENLVHMAPEELDFLLQQKAVSGSA